MTQLNEFTAGVLTAKAQQVGIPQHMIDGLVQYVVTGRQPGHFLTAILTNDLAEACRRADEHNQLKLFNYVFFLVNYTPAGCWGSERNMDEWRGHRGMLFDFTKGGDAA